jgi:hypothetical protein
MNRTAQLLDHLLKARGDTLIARLSTEPHRHAIESRDAFGPHVHICPAMRVHGLENYDIRHVMRQRKSRPEDGWQKGGWVARGEVDEGIS